MMRPAHILWLWAALALAAAAAPPLRAEVSFREISLRVAGKVDRRVFFDVNRDGRTDIVLLHGRTLLLYLQTGERSFRRWPDQVFPLARTAVLCHLDTLPAAGGTALVLAAEDGVFYHPFRDGRFQRDTRPLVRAPTVLGYPGRDDVLFRAFLFDADGDGRSDAVLPQAEGYGLYRQDEKGAFARAAVFPSQPAVSLRRPGPGVLGALRLTARFPAVFAADFDGDGLRDFLVRHRTYLMVYRQRKGAVYRTEHPDAVVDTRFPEEEEKKSGRFSLGFRSPVLVQDLDGDGVVDVVKPQPMLGRTLVFLRTGRETALADPQLVVRSDGWHLGALAPDLDGDGRADLVVGHVDKIGVLGALKIFLTQNVTVHSAYFVQKKGFPRRPDRTLSLTVPLRFATTADGFRLGTTALVNFDGDYDGDGRKDLLLKTGFQRLEIYRGADGTVFAHAPFLAVEIPDSEPYRWVYPDVADLNGDGLSDILLHYRDWTDRSDRLVLKLSRRTE